MIKEVEFGYELYQRIFKVTTDWIKEESIRNPGGPEAVDVIFSTYGTSMGKIAAKLAAGVLEMRYLYYTPLESER